jgi:hypothetical protein
MLLASLVLAATPASMTHLRADILYTLKHPDGRAAPSPMPRVWYFEVPKKRSDDASMNELLHRIFWDQNVAMREREPNDHAYLAMVSFKTSKVDKASVKASKGVDERAFGWFEANRAITSEPSATFIVDEQGRYDNIGVHDYTELLLHRMFDTGEVTEAEFVAFSSTPTRTAPSRAGCASTGG